MTGRLFDDGDADNAPAQGGRSASERGHHSGASSARPGETDVDPRADAPLAARLRPRTLDELVGQHRLLEAGAPLRQMLTGGRVRSLLLWGPPGTGKTSIAAVIARVTDAVFAELSAVTAGVKDVRTVIDQARERRRVSGRPTVLFIDEIHRFNKAQQDALLPAVEDGTVALIGATTENPSFEVNAPLRSRSMLLRLDPLGPRDILELLQRAVDDPRGLPGTMVEPEALDLLAHLAGGDARVALTTLEAAAGVADGGVVTSEHVQRALAAPALRYDKSGDNHYDQVSAFIKSMRGSDADAAVYWLVRMLTTGEDPRFLARRMVILASEDVGLADPGALQVAVAAFRALEVVGLPEARFALTQAAIHLALAPKSNSVIAALARADSAVARLANAPVPAHLRDAHYSDASALGHGEGYRYPHDDPAGWVEQRYLPEGLEPGDIYRPRGLGAEPGLGDWLPSDS